jgi:hypothetical protein
VTLGYASRSLKVGTSVTPTVTLRGSLPVGESPRCHVVAVPGRPPGYVEGAGAISGTLQSVDQSLGTWRCKTRRDRALAVTRLGTARDYFVEMFPERRKGGGGGNLYNPQSVDRCHLPTHTAAKLKKLFSARLEQTEGRRRCSSLAKSEL